MSADELPPLVTLAEPQPPRPGFWLGALLTFAYWVCLIGGMMVPVLVAAFLAKGEELNTDPDAGSLVAKLSPTFREGLAWAFPAGYLGGLLFSVIAIRVIVGRRWIRDIGLTRIAPYHLLLGLLVLPAFMILSEVLGKLVHPIDRPFQFIDLGDTGEALRAIFVNHHWAVTVLAVGIGPGLVEELWCRGFLGRGFIGRYGWFGGIALSSVFFGLLHAWPPSYVIVTAVMGSCLHYAYVTSRSLWVPVTMHVVNNCLATLGVLNLIPMEKFEANAAANETVITLLAGGVLLACGLAMWQARWSWPGERRGILVPPAGSAAELRSAAPSIILFAPAISSSAALIWLLIR